MEQVLPGSGDQSLYGSAPVELVVKSMSVPWSWCRTQRWGFLMFNVICHWCMWQKVASTALQGHLVCHSGWEHVLWAGCPGLNFSFIVTQLTLATLLHLFELQFRPLTRVDDDKMYSTVGLWALETSLLKAHEITLESHVKHVKAPGNQCLFTNSAPLPLFLIIGLVIAVTVLVMLFWLPLVVYTRSVSLTYFLPVTFTFIPYFLHVPPYFRVSDRWLLF